MRFFWLFLHKIEIASACFAGLAMTWRNNFPNPLTHREIKNTLTIIANQGIDYLSIWNLRDYCGPSTRPER